ncbi:MAG: hypothetical protein KAG14_04860 [Mycoplasmataceae bacterium]|nr:hypothetical protein [Mycoplasmataceae bacterium]
MTTLILAIVVVAINQLVKILIRVLGVSKAFAKMIVLAFGFILSCMFTLLQQKGVISPQMITQVVAFFLTTIGTYEMVLNKLGIDSWLKDAFAIERNNK